MAMEAKYIWAAIAGGLAFVLAKFALHHGFWFALLVGVVVAVIVLLLWVVFGDKTSAEGFAGGEGGRDAPTAAVPAAALATEAVAPVPTVPSTPVAAPVVAEVAASDPVVAAPQPLMAAAVAESPKPAVKAPAKKAPATKAALKPATKAGKAPAKARVAPKAVVEPKALAKAKAYGLTAPRGGVADDLKEIEGVGPALEKLLNGLGIWHFDQIAGWTDKDVAKVDGQMDRFKGRITRDKWVSQAGIIVSEGLGAFRERAKTNDY